MPTPGSHGYDVQRTRLRGKLETEGVNDKNADELANRIMQRDDQTTSPGLLSERAAGPYGAERTQRRCGPRSTPTTWPPAR